MESVIPNMEKAEENYKVPNLEKGIAVLEYLSLHTQGETLQDIKSALDISQTTAYRILNTLVRLDYLIYNEDTKRYKLSRKLLTLGFRSLNEHNLLETVLFARFARPSERDGMLRRAGGPERYLYRAGAGTSYVPFYPLAGKTFRFALFGSGKGDHGLFAEYSPGPIFVLYGIYTLQRPDYYYT